MRLPFPRFWRRARPLPHLDPLMLGGRNVLPTQIYLLRHGESEGNVDDKKYGETHDARISLSAKGREQIRMAANEKLLPELLQLSRQLGRPINVGVIFSGYTRTTESKDILIQTIFGEMPDEGALRLKLEREDPNLVERRYSAAASLSKEEYYEQFGDEVKTAEFAPEFHRDLPGGVESDFRLCRRALEAVSGIFKVATYDLLDVVIVISHKDFLRAFEKSYFGLTEAEYEKLPPPDNASVRLIERLPFYDPKRCPESAALNDRIKSFDLGTL